MKGIFKKNRKGFTLVELLATIAILAIVVGLVIYVAIGAINEGKKKTYQTTIKNVETNASSYLTENAKRLFFLSLESDSDNEYQCVTVKNLMDTGFLDKKTLESKVSNDKTVNPNDYVYVERNGKTKAIIKTVYDNDKYAALCGKAVLAIGDIKFDFEPDLNTYSTYKNIEITYKLKNANDVQTLNEYLKEYLYSGEYIDGGWNSGDIRKIKVTSNGKLTASISHNGENIAIKEEEIKTIDLEGPVIIHNYIGDATVKKTVTIPLNIKDAKSGLDKTSVTVDDFNVTIGGILVTDIQLKAISDNGNCNLIVNNLDLAGELVITINKDKIKDKLGNGNEAVILKPGVTFDNTYKVSLDGNGGTINPTSMIVTYNKPYGTLPTGSRTGFSLGGFYTAKTGGTEITSSTVVTTSNDHTLYARWIGNELVFNDQSLGNGTSGTAFTSSAFTGASNGTGNYTYTIKSGAPSGATISTANRTISFPNTATAGTYEVVVLASDTVSNKTKEAKMTIVIKPKPTNTPTKKPTNTPTRKPTNTATKKPNTTTKKPNTTTKKPTTKKPTTKKPTTKKPTTKKPTTKKPTTKKTSGGGTGSCFPAGTKVATMMGYKNIEDIRFGDIILTYNEETGKNEYQRVMRLLVSKLNSVKEKNQKLHTLTFDDNSNIMVSANHSFYIMRNNQIHWISAHDIVLGDYVRYADGTYHMVTNNVSEELHETIYNLVVDKNHNYYVGDQKILVHNAVYFKSNVYVTA